MSHESLTILQTSTINQYRMLRTILQTSTMNQYRMSTINEYRMQTSSINQYRMLSTINQYRMLCGCHSNFFDWCVVCVLFVCSLYVLYCVLVMCVGYVLV